MDVIRWAETDRERLRTLLPESLVVVPMGATEQHGPHLPTGTDALLATEVAERAAALARVDSARDLVLTPSLTIGASDHHIPFGGTLSLTPETLLAVVLDVAHSVARAGGRRMVLLNGHGGNTGVCQAAAGAAGSRWDLAVAQFDYWSVAAASDDGTPVPGHAGAFETSLVLAARPELVRDRQERAAPPLPPADVHSAAGWSRMDGYTDQPHRAEQKRGEAWLDQIASAVAARFVELAGAM